MNSPYGFRITLTCQCGKAFEVMPYLAKTRRSCSRICACRFAKRPKEQPLLRKWKHVTHLNGKYHPLHGVWRNMIGRCSKPTHISYSDYGGRGIRVCKRWLNWDAFHDWALANGYERGLWIERKNNDRDYCPSNCLWTTPQINECNRRNTPSVSITLSDGSIRIASTRAEAARFLGVCHNTVRNSLLGWNVPILEAKGAQLSYV